MSKLPKTSPPTTGSHNGTATGELAIVRLPLKDLVPDAGNARDHDEKNLAAIRDSLITFGQVEPLVVQRSNGMAIGGNGRLTVMKALSWTHAMCVQLDVDDTEARRLSLALNRTSELARWNDTNLRAALKQLAQGTPNIVIPGFSADDLKAHLRDQGDFLSSFMTGAGGDAAGGGGASQNPGQRATFVDLVLSLKPDDRAMVYAVLQKVRETKKLASSSDALLEVVRHYERTAT